MAVKSRRTNKIKPNKVLDELLEQLDAKDSFALAMRGKFQGELPPGVVPEGLATVWSLFAKAFKNDVEPQYESISARECVLEKDLKARLTATGKNSESARELG